MRMAGFEPRELPQSGRASVIFVPLLSNGVASGVLSLVAARRLRGFTSADVSTAEDLAARIGVTLDNARLYRRTREAVKAREEVLALVAHDLRNPLGAIILSTAGASRRAPEAERGKGWPRLDRVRRLAHHMNRLIGDLLDVASLDTSNLHLQLLPHDAGQLMADAFASLEPLAGKKSVALRMEPPLACGPVACDGERVLQVFSNVVGNAVKFTPAGGTVTISARPESRKVVFSVTDTGPGIATRDVDRIFDKYWQAEEGADKGRGLGLYIARRLVEAHGGTIWCESAPGRGTTVSFTVPRASRAPARPSTRASL
jgi:signal transduction histidine kinase